jgi:hypothetical protein
VKWREGAYVESNMFNLPCYQAYRIILVVPKQNEPMSPFNWCLHVNLTDFVRFLVVGTHLFFWLTLGND